MNRKLASNTQITRSSLILDKQDDLDKVVAELSRVFSDILTGLSFRLPIAAKTRSGAEISDFLEGQFIQHINLGKSTMLSDAVQGQGTKSPFDFKCLAKLGSANTQLVYCDIKTAFIKEEKSNSAPDMGAINKYISFFKDGNTCFIFIFLKYKSVKQGFEVVKFTDDQNPTYFLIYPLQYISSSVSLNLKNQIQINFEARPRERTRKEFLELLKNVYVKGYKALLERTKKRLKAADKTFAFIHEQYRE
ncbi:MAG: hypothetical protein A2142_05840 [candidate division Zixibacteria bacterium RBG_16_48_11]|nr:MAG: hypothetical protein A2142_05840 [candidate division Zixibacteria bacterium RBG_16_48_11]